MIIQRLESRLGQVVSVPDLKVHLRIDHDDEDIDLQRMAMAAAREAEDTAHLALLSQAVRVTFRSWPVSDGRPLRLPIGPIGEPVTVTISAGGEDYDSFTVSPGLRPTIRLTGPRPCGLIEIEYVAGYGNTPDTIPDDLQQAILDQAACYYEQRAGKVEKAKPQSPHFARIIGRYRGVRL